MPRAYDMRGRLGFSVAGKDGLLSPTLEGHGGGAASAKAKDITESAGADPARVDPAARGWLAGSRQRDTPFLFITAFDFKNLISVSSSCLRNVSSATRTYAARSTMGLLYQNFSR
jgi:hypothetical protein